MKKLYLLLAVCAFVKFAALAQSPHAAQLYGMTEYGSYNKKGSIFHYTPGTHTFTTDYNFQIKTKGRIPKCEIVAGNNGKYYGTTTAGGDYNAGVLFEWDSVTSVYKDLHNFTGSDGRDARGGMVLYNNKLYGTTNAGGTNNDGVIYEWDIAANTYTKKIDLDSAGGRNATGSLTVVNDLFYGFTNSGGVNDKGVLFEWNPATNVYTKKFDFDSTKGSNPTGKLTAYNGKLYAMCNKGGAFNAGTIYQWDYANNTVTNTFDFNNTNGAFPSGYLTLYNNKLYGTTNEGGKYQTSVEQTGILRHYGVIFEYNPANNAFVKKKDLGFNGDFRGPLGSLTLKDTVFWSTASEDASGSGGIFTWNPATNQFLGKYSFSAYTATSCEVERPAIGTQPFESLLLSGNYLLGSASEGAGNNFGTLYKFLPDSNQITALVNMEATDGAYPKGSLTKLGNKLYGLTFQGGNSHAGNIFEWDLKTQQYKERFQLDGLTTGIWPKGSLTYYSGKFYGINTYGKLISGNASFNQRDPGDYFSWDPLTNQYQSLLSANYARCTPVLFNKKLYTTTESSSIPYFSAINAFDPATNTLTEAASMDPNVGTFNNYQDAVSANGVTYYNGKFYGTTPAKYSSGAVPFMGAIYEWDTLTSVMAHRIDFVDSIGTYPTGNLLLVGNEFYGLASNNGNNSGSYPSLFKWNPATNVLQKIVALNDNLTGTPVYSGGKIYFLGESSFLNLYEYDPVLDTTITVYTEPIPLFQPGGNWNYTNCRRPLSYQQLLEVIPNEAPVLVSSPSAQNTCVNRRDSTSFTITDTDSDTMHFRITSSNISLLPVANISVSNAGNLYTLAYFGNTNQTGTTTISVTANDGYGDSVSFSFPVTILAATQSPCNALPVTMLSFSAQADARTSLLNWQTTAEYDTKGYEIERSVDGNHFTKIGFAPAVNSATGSAYSFTDMAPQNGYNYYRLKTLDINGAFTYTPVRSVEFTSAGNKITIYPNPVKDFLFVKMNAQGKYVSIVLTDVAGKKLFEAIKPDGQVIKVPVAKIQAGVYLLTLFDGTNKWTKKIIKE